MRKEEECIQQKRLPGAELLRAMEQYCSEAVDALTDLFVCGLCSVQDTTVKYINEIATDGERLGFHRAGSGLNEISQRLTMRRHQMESESAPVVEEMAKLCRYFMMCKEKLSYDNVFLTMREERQDESE